MSVWDPQMTSKVCQTSLSSATSVSFWDIVWVTVLILKIPYGGSSDCAWLSSSCPSPMVMRSWSKPWRESAEGGPRWMHPPVLPHWSWFFPWASWIWPCIHLLSCPLAFSGNVVGHMPSSPDLVLQKSSQYLPIILQGWKMWRSETGWCWSHSWPKHVLFLNAWRRGHIRFSSSCLC